MRTLTLSALFVALAASSLALKYNLAERDIALDLDGGQQGLIDLAQTEGFAARREQGGNLGRIFAEKDTCRFTAWFALRPLYESDAYRKHAANYDVIHYVWDGQQSDELPLLAATYRYFKQGVLINLGQGNARGAIVGVARNSACDTAQLPDFSQVMLEARAGMSD